MALFIVLLALAFYVFANNFALSSVSRPTASQLLALLRSCNQVSNGLYRTDGDAAQTIPICQLDGAIFWRADMDIDCDGQVTNVCNSSTDSLFQPDTAAHTAAGQPLDASMVRYVVIPGESSTFRYSHANIQLGAVVAVIYNGRVQYGVVGDTGPEDIIGEASYAMAQSLGIDPNPAAGGVDGDVWYIVFQGSTVLPIDDQNQAVRVGEQLAAQLISTSGHQSD
jgi:hypothetical protein